MTTFEIDVSHDGASLTLTVTPPSRGGDTFEIAFPGNDARVATWSLGGYAVSGLENDALAEAIADALFDEYAESWTLDVKTLEPGEGEVADDRIDRLGGSPIGVSIERWPSCIGEPMQHIVTLSTSHLDTPEALPDGTAAVAVFMWNPEENEAFEPDTAASAVLMLSADEVAAGTTSERPEGYDATREMDAAPLVVETQTGTHFDLVGDHVGWPIHWCQDDESEPEHGAFLFQFTEDLIDVNLGDAGTMYVFANAAWWQCH